MEKQQKPEIAEGLKLLFIDIETSPTKAYVWGLHNENIGVEQIVEPGAVLCFSALWHGSTEIKFYSRWGDGQRRMIRAAHRLLNEADAVCHFNGTSFDIPHLNTEFIKHNMGPTAPIPQIDLLRTVQRKFKTPSNRLMFWGPYLKIGEKVKHEGFPLWVGCMNGDKDCQKLMMDYNIRDTQLLEPFYEKALPWIDNHPNRAMFVIERDGKLICPSCGLETLYSNGLRRGTTYTYIRYHCKNCNAWPRARMSTQLYGKPPLVRGL